MKTLKKTLSLTLVFALVFSLMSFAFAAPTAKTTAAKLSDFTDKDQLTYTEAADYLIAAGVVKGDTDTTLNPKGDLTREQAAKLIAYACLGQIAADNLKAGSAPFTDVAADRWSAGYIAYCQKQGIINGLGDGTFNPTAKVTGYQYAKMLLCSIGYGVNGEFTGAGWDLEVAKLALAYGIFDGNTTGANSNAANREEAFLYTFNTLSKLCAVSYNKALGVYYVPGRDALTTNPMSATITLASNLDTRADTVGAVKFGMKRVGGQTGVYGEAAHYWAKSNTKVTGKYADASFKKLASSLNGTTFASLQDSSKSTYIGYKADSTLKYFYNGDKINVEATTTTTADYATGDYVLVGSIAAGGTIYKMTATLAKGGVIGGGNSTSLGTYEFDGKRGVEVNFYDTDENGKYDVVEFIQDKITKVTADATATASGSVTLVTVPGITNLSAKKSDNVTGYEGLKKGDYVTYHTNIAGDTWTITKCGSFTGTMAAYNTSAGVAMIGTTQYKTSELAYQTGSNPTASFASDYANLLNVADSTYYTDKGGNLVAYIAGSSVAKLSNTVYVIDAVSVGHTYQAKLLDSTGAVVYANINKVDDVAVSNVTPTAGNTTGSFTVVGGATKDFNKFYTYSKNTDGTYNLTSVATQAAGVYDAANETVFAKGAANFYYDTAPAIQNKLATAATVFVIEGNTAGTYKAYTGVGTNPKVTSKTSGTYASVLYDADGYAIFAVAVGGVVDTTSTNKDYIFTSAPATTFKDGNGNYYGYTTSVLNGAITPIVYATNTTALIPGTLQAIDSYDNTRVQTASLTDTRIIAPVYDVRSFRVNGATISAYSDVNATTLAGSYVAASDCKYFLYDVTDPKNPTLKASTADEISGLSGKYYEIQGVTVSDTNTQLAQVYVTVYNTATSAAVADLQIKAGGSKGVTITTTNVTATTAAAAAAAPFAATGFADGSADTIQFTSASATTLATALDCPVVVKDINGNAQTTLATDIDVGSAVTNPPTVPARVYAICFYAQPFVYQVRYAVVTVAA